MMVIANVFPKLQTVKTFVRPLSKHCSFRKRSDSQHVKVAQILAKSPSEHFSHLFSAIWAKLIWKISPLVLAEIFGVFVKTLPVDGKYPVEHYENLPLPIQMILSKQEKPVSQFFVKFLESTSNFKHFEQKMMFIGNVFPKLETLKILAIALSKNRSLRIGFDTQHVKVSHIPMKPPSEHFSHLFSAFWAKFIWKMSSLVLG